MTQVEDYRRYSIKIMVASATTPPVPVVTLGIQKKLKHTKEQKQIVGPLVERLCSFGWHLDQVIFGKNEWHTPKRSPQQRAYAYHHKRKVEFCVQ